MNSLSPWAADANDLFSHNSLSSLYEKKSGNIEFNIYATTDSIWLLSKFPGDGKAAFRLAYAPDSSMAIGSIRQNNNFVTLKGAPVLPRGIPNGSGSS